MKKLSKILRGLIYILPAVLFFSYYPIIRLGSNEAMNFELSLSLIWLVVFDLVAGVAWLIKKDFSVLKKGWWLSLLPIFVTLSLIWTENLMRGVLTVGVMWLIVFAVYAVFALHENLRGRGSFAKIFMKMFLGSALVISVWCVIQCVLDVMGVGREYTLLCQGCTYRTFGFPHPNGFAIEPQFMGNLLLAPTLVAMGMLMGFDEKKERRNFWMLLVIGIALCSALFLTFSRGAIYALVVALIFMSAAFLMQIDKNKKIAKRIGLIWGMVILSFGFTLNLQGVLSVMSPTNDTYFSGVAKVLNHLSLGIIDVRGNVEVEAVEEESENVAVFDGYVAESTNVRMELTKNAIEVWKQDFGTMMFGVGIGGAGQAMYDANLTGTPKEIVQNEYASLLLEVGIIGVLLLIVTLILMIKISTLNLTSSKRILTGAKKSSIKNPMNITILSLTVGYGVSLLFFSGLANALQIYLLPPILYTVFLKKLVS